MLSTRLGLFGALALFFSFPQVSNVSHPQSTPEKIAHRQLGRIKDKSERGDGTATSSNWSGYSVLGSSFTSAAGSWVVPQATCTGVSGDQYAAFWVGLDGYNSNTVEQTGTMTECVGRTATYYAWYEFFPNPLYEFTGVPVSPGQTVSASVQYVNGEFTVTITNVTTGKSASKSGNVSGAERTSAEWITEAPCCTLRGGILPLADFGTAEFGANYTGVASTNFAVDSSTSGSIGAFPSADIEVIEKTGSSTSPQTSTCSTLLSGTSFSCTWAQ
jgi:hypothetical protein